MFCLVVFSDSSSKTERITSFLNSVNSVNALYTLLRKVISFYLHYVNTFVLYGQVPAPSSPEKRRSSLMKLLQ